VLLLGFRRVENLWKTTEVVLNSGATHLYLAVDGPIHQADHDIQQTLIAGVARLAKEHGIPIRILTRESNLGLSIAVISAVDWFFENEEQGIILEDDLEISPDLVKFLNLSLAGLKRDQNTWLISANQFLDAEFVVGDNQWCNYPLIWGWATWKDRWLEIRRTLLNETLTFNVAVSPKVRAFLRVGKLRVSKGRVNSWAIPFASGMRSQGKYCYMPPVNLASNVGVDELATHTKSKGWHLGRSLGELNSTINLDSQSRAYSSKRSNRLIEVNVYKVSWKSVISLCWIWSTRFFSSSEMQSMEVKLNDARKIGRELR